MRNIVAALCAVTLVALTGCMGGKATTSSGRGGEVTGVGGGRSFKEPAPFGMTMIKRGFLKMGIDQQDTLWGKQTPVKEISVDGFWMDETEVTNSKYKQFVFWVRDSISFSVVRLFCVSYSPVMMPGNERISTGDASVRLDFRYKPIVPASVGQDWPLPAT